MCKKAQTCPSSYLVWDRSETDCVLSQKGVFIVPSHNTILVESPVVCISSPQVIEVLTQRGIVPYSKMENGKECEI